MKIFNYTNLNLNFFFVLLLEIFTGKDEILRVNCRLYTETFKYTNSQYKRDFLVFWPRDKGPFGYKFYHVAWHDAPIMQYYVTTVTVYLFVLLVFQFQFFFLFFFCYPFCIPWRLSGSSLYFFHESSVKLPSTIVSSSDFMYVLNSTI